MSEFGLHGLGALVVKLCSVLQGGVADLKKQPAQVPIDVLHRLCAHKPRTRKLEEHMRTTSPGKANQEETWKAQAGWARGGGGGGGTMYPKP